MIIWGGGNGINKNEANTGLKQLQKYVTSRHNTNIMIVTAPHRHDLQVTTCVNKEIEVFNRILQKMMKITDNVDTIQLNLSRNDFT